MTDIKTLADVDKIANQFYIAGKVDVLKELISIWKPRYPEEPFTTNAILLELEVRLRILEENHAIKPHEAPCE
jgi:hypothetical protein